MSNPADTPSHKSPVIIITGPTASGKSYLANRLAHKINGAIINADSMQIYRDLPILTAIPTQHEQQLAPHFLYGILDGSDVCSAGRWCQLANQAIDQVIEKGMQPIICGGTGFYLKALTEGLAAIPEIEEGSEKALMAIMKSHEIGSLYDRLAQVDPISAQNIDPSDTQRLVRALAVYQTTGMALSDWQKNQEKIDSKYQYQKFALIPDRDVTNHRISARIPKMIEAGALEEVAALLRRNLPYRTTITRALGVSEFIDYLDQRVTLDEACQRLATSTRRYAKRQRTWLRTQSKDYQRFDIETIDDSIMDGIVQRIIEQL